MARGVGSVTNHAPCARRTTTVRSFHKGERNGSGSSYSSYSSSSSSSKKLLPFESAGPVAGLSSS
ncbi:hypothetical protein, partial [Segatella baroniae]|uniref:hypothetical protein n=1 Tax=Segatella baroniae TaxID=305719 RepID=UPI001EE2AB96